MAAARSLHATKGRRTASAFLVEGPHAVVEALQAGHQLRELFVTEAAARREVEVLRLAATASTVVHTVTESVMAGLAETTTPAGIVAVAAVKPVDIEAVAVSARLAVVLAGVSDPGNAGTVIRTADAYAADLVIASTGSVDVHAGKCVRASAGSLFHLPVATEPLAHALDVLTGVGLQLWAAAADGPDDLDDLSEGGSFAVPGAWLFGNEAHGLPPPVLARADHVVRITTPGRAESLNLAAAAAVCLHASNRGRIRSH